MGDSTEELEPLFDYSRVQPLDIVCLDDDDSDTSQAPLLKRRKIPEPVVDKAVEELKIIKVDCEEEDWLPPPPKVSGNHHNQLNEDSTIKALRLQKQELLSFAKSAKHVLQEVEEFAKRDLALDRSLYSSFKAVAGEPSKPSCERAKIVISIQDKEEQKQFRLYMDVKFERLFKIYSNRVKLDSQRFSILFRWGQN